MDIIQVGSRGTMVTYQDLVDTEFSCSSNIYIINAGEDQVVIDTFLGPDIMARTWRELARDPREVRTVVNTHSDWDHIWGNAYFTEATFLAHDKFSSLVVLPDSPSFQELKPYAMGTIKLRMPDLTFDSRLQLPALGLKLFASAGHTADSISVYDEVDRILIVGDNCEAPIPSYINPFLLEQHLATLRGYLTWDFAFIVPGHGPLMTRDDLLGNIEYLEAILEGDTGKLRQYSEGPAKLTHLTNLAILEDRD